MPALQTYRKISKKQQEDVLSQGPSPDYLYVASQEITSAVIRIERVDCDDDSDDTDKMM